MARETGQDWERRSDWSGKSNGVGRPAFLRGEPVGTYYDGIGDDLLTAGFGRAALAGPDPLAPPPGPADPAAPPVDRPPTLPLSSAATAGEQRRKAILLSHLDLIDRNPGAGYGSLHGPGLVAGEIVHDGRVAGHEYVLALDPLAGDDPVVVVVQIPDSFDPARPCLLAAASSGSRGVYGAVAFVGEWALPRGFAVVYTDKGTGIGVHDLEHNLAFDVRGVVADADALGRDAHFRADLDADGRRQFLSAWPHRLAFKHAHGRANPERYWGREILRAIEAAYYVLNRHFATEAEERAPITPATTTVIAAGLSNGGGAALRAAEEDEHDLIDGVVASEPAIYPVRDASFVIRQGEGPAFAEHGLSIVEVMSLLNVYQACASLHREPGKARPAPTAGSMERCQRLKGLGLLVGETTAELAAAAQRKINAAGIAQEQNWLQPLHHFWYVPLGVTVTYANAYGRFAVTDRLAGYSVAATDPGTGVPVPLSFEVLASLYWSSNGTPPHPLLNIGVINDRGGEGGREDRASTPDQNLAGALALHALVTGVDPLTDQPLTGEAKARHARIAEGIGAVRATGDLRGKPAVIIHGREDAILFPNHTARPYYARNQVVEGAGSRLRYYEVTHAHHLDVWNGLYVELAANSIPLRVYFLQALDRMWRHLREDAPLPPSQVVVTRPRGPGGPPLSPTTAARHLPPISDEPGANRIVFTGDALIVPEGRAATEV